MKLLNVILQALIVWDWYIHKNGAERAPEMVNKADRHKSRAHTKEETHIQTLNWPTHLQICILAHLNTCTFVHLLIYTLA